MTERDMLADTAADLLARHCPARAVPRAGGEWMPDLWDRLEDLGFTRIALAADAGGGGASIVEDATVLRALARAAAPVPAAETSLAAWALAEASLPVPPGPLTVAPTGNAVRWEETGASWRVVGRLRQVPWARISRRVVIVGSDGDRGVVLAPAIGDCSIEAGENVAGEARDDVVVDTVAGCGDGGWADPGIVDELMLRAALARAVQLSSSLDRVLELTVEHVRDRRQFGRPIGGFQAVQQQVALLAGEVVSARAAVGAALAEADATGFRAATARTAIAAAKVRACRAATAGTAIAHQLHGAVGVTQEHELALHTRRLLSWRDEWGTERQWAGTLGRAAAVAGPVGAWDQIVGAPA